MLKLDYIDPLTYVTSHRSAEVRHQVCRTMPTGEQATSDGQPLYRFTGRL